MYKGSSISNVSIKEPKIDTCHTTSMLLGLWQSFVKESCKRKKRKKRKKKKNLANNMPNRISDYTLTFIIWRKLYFITLNYVIYYTLHPKLFECTFYTINYDPCYTLHTNVKFGVNLNENSKFMVHNVIRNIVSGGKV